jgi:hypothetical protein
MAKVEISRVEPRRRGGRSGLSVSPRFLWECLKSPALTRFPQPAHRTGRAGFPHPALRRGSPQGMRERRPPTRAQPHQAYLCPERLIGEASGPPPGDFVASRQKLPQPHAGIHVQGSVDSAERSYTEVVRPAHQAPVHLGHHVGSAALVARRRHSRTWMRSQPSSAARGSFLHPSAAPRMMRARRATACGVVCARTRRSRIARWAAETAIGNGCGPGNSRTPLRLHLRKLPDTSNRLKCSAGLH